MSSKKKKKKKDKKKDSGSSSITSKLKKLAASGNSAAKKLLDSGYGKTAPKTDPKKEAPKSTTPAKPFKEADSKGWELKNGQWQYTAPLGARATSTTPATQTKPTSLTTPPPISKTPQGGNPTTLGAFYSSQGKTLPSLPNRFNDASFAAAAKAAGISQGTYTGSIDQNNAILSKLRSTTGSTPAGQVAGAETMNQGAQVASNGKTYDQIARGLGYANFDSLPSAHKTALLAVENYRANQAAQQPVTEEAVDTPEDDTVEVDSSPIFMGDQTLVKYNNWYYLVDTKEGTMRPFESTAAIYEAYGDNAEDALLLAESQTITDRDMGAFDNFEILGSDYAIKGDGSRLPYENSESSIKARYNNQIDLDGEFKAFMSLDRFVDLLSQDTSGINDNTVNKIKSDNKKIAFYLNALTYGGYTLADVYKDIKREDLIASGASSSDIANLKPISASENRSVYGSSTIGMKALGDDRLAPPADLVGLNSQVMNLPIYSMPDEAFKELVPALDWNSPEFQARLDEVQSLHHDVLMQQLQAETEQDKAIADYNWEKFRSEINRQFGIELSNNAYEAWNQLEGFRGEFSQRGLMNSGIQAQSLDKYLRQIREVDTRQRQEVKVKEEEKQQNIMMNYASSEEIKRLVEEDKASGLPKEQWRATRWGLVPSENVVEELSFDKLKEKFPDMKDEDIQKKISLVLDENGNYRSTLYKRYMEEKVKNEEDFEEYAADQVYNQELDKEEEAYRQYTTPDSPFLRTENDGTTPETDPIQLNMPNQFRAFRKRFEQPKGGKTQEDAAELDMPGGNLGSTSSSFYRDPQGNILDSTGKIIVDKAATSKWSESTRQKAGAFPLYGSTTQNKTGGNKSLTGSNTQGSTTKYTPAKGGKIKLNDTQINTLKKKNPTLAKTMGFI